MTFVVRAPSVLLTEAPGPVSDDVVDWLAAAMSHPGVAELWKLATVEAAAAQCYFLPEQCWKVCACDAPDATQSLAYSNVWVRIGLGGQHSQGITHILDAFVLQAQFANTA